MRYGSFAPVRRAGCGTGGSAGARARLPDGRGGRPGWACEGGAYCRRTQWSARTERPQEVAPVPRGSRGTEELDPSGPGSSVRSVESSRGPWSRAMLSDDVFRAGRRRGRRDRPPHAHGRARGVGTDVRPGRRTRRGEQRRRPCPGAGPRKRRRGPCPRGGLRGSRRGRAAGRRGPHSRRRLLRLSIRSRTPRKQAIRSEIAYASSAVLAFLPKDAQGAVSPAAVRVTASRTDSPAAAHASRKCRRGPAATPPPSRVCPWGARCR